MGFNAARLFVQQMNSLRSLPVFGPEYQPKQAIVETAFSGVLQTYEIVNNFLRANTVLSDSVRQLYCSDSTEETS